MLRYLGYGERRYGERQVQVFPRSWWEIQFCFSGTICPTGKGFETQDYGQCVWIFTPELAHGWTAPASSVATVGVFHVDTVPSQVAESVEESGWLRLDLSLQDCQRFDDIAQRALSEQQSPSSAWMLIDELIQLEVQWLIARQQDEPIDSQARAKRIVDRGLAWFEEHIAKAPGLSDVANAIHCSVAHWRRLCHQAYERKPQELCDDIRLKHMCYHLREGKLSQEGIAARCGLSSASAVSRTFRRLNGLSPRQWLAQEESHYFAKDQFKSNVR